MHKEVPPVQAVGSQSAAGTLGCNDEHIKALAPVNVQSARKVRGDGDASNATGNLVHHGAGTSNATATRRQCPPVKAGDAG